ncbi:MAG: thiol:disulfide interchange protein, partial [Alphaproteobacteria bacterium]|nr:thiol:disulfide interchange protein [Alphaproteobacteria bacterium]
MKRLLVLLLLLIGAAPAFGQTPASQAVVQTDNVRAELLADVSAVKPGQSFWVALRQTIRPKWHTYWKNPGESGLPTEIKWDLPEGVTAEPIVWPTPRLFDIGGVVNYGFQDEAMLLVRITPPKSLTGNALKIGAEANWLVCEDVCIPEEAKFELSLPIAAAASSAPPATQALFDKARRSVPTESPWPARYGMSKSGDPTLLVEAKGLKPDGVRDVYFFPADWGPVAAMAKQSAKVGADGIRIPLKRGDAKSPLPDRLAGTLVLTEKTADGDVKHAFDISAKLDPALVGGSSLAGAEGAEALSLVRALLFALLGGLILNLMPCVFPVLAMKAAAFARLAGHERSVLRRDGIAYTLGVLA